VRGKEGLVGAAKPQRKETRNLFFTAREFVGHRVVVKTMGVGREKSCQVDQGKSR